MEGLTLVKHTALANLAATAISLVLWGFYTCLFMRTMRVLRQKRYGPFSLTTICIGLCFVFNIMNTVATLAFAFRGFITFSEGPSVYYTLIALKAVDNVWIAIFDFTLAAAAISGDILMLWRLYVVWGRDKRVLIVPVLLTTVGLAGCAVIVYFDVMAGTRLQEPGFAAQIYAVTITVFVMNIITTWYLTGFICYRLWSSGRQTRGIDDYEARSRTTGAYGRIIRVLIQSGMLYSVTELFFMLCIATKSDNGISVMADLDTRMIGIVTTLIVLQLNNSEGETTTIITIPRARTLNGHYSVRVTKHTDVKSDEQTGDVEMNPVSPGADIVKSHVWA